MYGVRIDPHVSLRGTPAKKHEFTDSAEAIPANGWWNRQIPVLSVCEYAQCGEMPGCYGG